MSKFQKLLYSGAAYDAMRLLGFTANDFYINIKPMAGYTKTNFCLCGFAFTTVGNIIGTDNYEEADKIRLKIYEKSLKNSIVMLQANDNTVAHSGDITSLIYQSLGAKGFITDGNVRDLDIIDKLKFPTFCKDSNPIDAIDYWALTNFDVPIYIDNVKINPGDFIVASMDGVIVVPFVKYNEFEKKATEVLEKEINVRNAVLDSTNLSKTINDIFNKEGRW